MSFQRSRITWGHIITLLIGWAVGDVMPTFTDPIHFWLVTSIPQWNLPRWEQSLLYFYDWYLLDITTPLLFLVAIWIALQLGLIQRRGVMSAPVNTRGLTILVSLLSFGIAVGILFNYSTTGHLWTLPQL